MRAGIGLEGAVELLPLVAETGGDAVEVERLAGAAEERSIETESPFQHRKRPAEPGAREHSRRHPGMGGPPGVQGLRPRTVFVRLQNPRCLAAGDSGRVCGPGRVKPEHAPGENGRGDRSQHAGGMKAVIVKPSGRHAAEPAVELVAGRDQHDGFPAARAHPFAEGKRGRHHRRAAVHDGFVVGVVEVLRVGLGAVRERRGRRRSPFAGRDEAGAAPRSEAAGCRVHGTSHGRAGATDDEPESVEHPHLDVGDDPLGQILVPQSEGPVCEFEAQAVAGHDVPGYGSTQFLAMRELRVEFAHDVHEQFSLLDGVVDGDVGVSGHRVPVPRHTRFRRRAVALPHPDHCERLDIDRASPKRIVAGEAMQVPLDPHRVVRGRVYATMTGVPTVAQGEGTAPRGLRTRAKPGWDLLR